MAVRGESVCKYCHHDEFYIPQDGKPIIEIKCKKCNRIVDTKTTYGVYEYERNNSKRKTKAN